MSILIKIIFILLLLLSTKSFGQVLQKDTASKNSYSRTICCNDLPKFIDSLRNSVVNDTSKYNSIDVSYTAYYGYMNSKPYSLLYVINGKYTYKLDIIDGTLVNDFAKEYLDISKVEIIGLLKSSSSTALYGKDGQNGAVFITLKKGIKFNPKVAGLAVSKKRGDNYTVRKKMNY